MILICLILSELIEISRYYEKLPKTTLEATEEFLNDELYFRLQGEDEA